MRRIILSLFVLGTVNAFSQVGINTTSPEASLDIVATNAKGTTTNVEGILIPRVDRQKAQSMTAVPNATLIFVNSIATGTSSGQASNITTTGYYYYDLPTAKWVKLVAGDLSSDAFVDNPAQTRVELGTKSDGKPRAAKTEFVITDDGKVGIGTNTPTQALHIAGNTRIEGTIYDGNNSAGTTGQVLSNDGTKVKWIDDKATIPAVMANFGSGYSDSDTANKATGTTITLPPGKWIVNTSILINTDYKPNSTQGVWVRLTWSDTSGGNSSSDIIGGNLLSGALVGPADYGMVVGTTVINNTTGANKTYHLTKKNQDYYGWLAFSKKFYRLGGSGVSENNIVAYPAN